MNLSYDVEKKFIKLDRNVNCFQSVFCSDQDLRISLLLVFLKVAKSRKGTKGAIANTIFRKKHFLNNQ